VLPHPCVIVVDDCAGHLSCWQPFCSNETAS
jgi:hypothetical protein